MKIRHIAALAMLLASGPALSWTDISNKKTGVCGFSGSFEGPGEPSLTIFQRPDMFESDQVGFMIINSNWSLKVGDKMDSKFEFETDDHLFPYTPAAIDNGLTFFFSTKEAKEISDALPNYLKITKDGTTIASFNLSGTMVEFMMFYSCIREKEKAKADQERKAKLEELPKDPFAK